MKPHAPYLVTPPTAAQGQGVGFHVAPMQGYTHAAMRELFAALSPETTLWTEMEKVGDLLTAEPSGLARRFGGPGYKSFVLQLGGNDPRAIGRCLRHLSRHGFEFQEINLNCGCPSIESGGAAYGARLMKQPELTQNLLAAIHENKGRDDTVVSMKCRISVHENAEELSAAPPTPSLSEPDYRALHDYIARALDGGMGHLVLHARAAILAGLSPRKNRQVPVLDYDSVRRVQQDFPHVPVTLNGGIYGFDQCHVLRTKQMQPPDPGQPRWPTSFMAGRWMLHRPLDLARVAHALALPENESDLVGTANPSRQVIQAVEHYTSYVRQSLHDASRQPASHPTLRDLCQPLYLITEQLREAFVDRQANELGHHSVKTPDRWLEEREMSAMFENICDAIRRLQEANGGQKRATSFPPTSMAFNHVSTAFKHLVGTKVLNKWKRNRAEIER